MEIEEELSSLIRKLNDESAFIQSEKKHIIDLYRQVYIKKFYYFIKNISNFVKKKKKVIKKIRAFIS